MAKTEGPTGYYGSRVDQGIRGFQKDDALKVDGLINPDGDTLRRLGAVLSEPEQPSLQATGISSMVRPAFAQTEVLPDKQRPLYTQVTVPLQDRVADWLSRTGAALVAGGDPAAPPSPPRGMQRTAAAEGAQHNEPGKRASLEEVATPVENDSSAAQEPPHLAPVLNQIGTIYRNRVEGLRRRGMPLAAANLEHFLDGSGEPRKLSRDEAIKLEPIKKAEATNMERFASRTFRGITDRNEAVKKLQHLRAGDHPFQFDDEWDREFEYGDYLWNAAIGDRDFAAAIGRAQFSSKGNFSAVRTGDVITISGTVTHTLHDDYDFHRWQPIAEGALASQEFRGAKPFLFGTEWKQPIIAVVPVKEGRLGKPKVTWGDIKE